MSSPAQPLPLVRADIPEGYLFQFSGRYCQLCEHPICLGIDGSCDGVELRECAECIYEAGRTDQVFYFDALMYSCFIKKKNKAFC